jgi:hypothetical protein
MHPQPSASPGGAGEQYVKEAAKEQQGKRNDLNSNIEQQIAQSNPKPKRAPQTRDIRAKAAGPDLCAFHARARVMPLR